MSFPKDNVFAFVMQDFEEILRDYLVELSLRWSRLQGVSEITFFATDDHSNTREADRLTRFRNTAVNTPVLFVHGEYMDLADSKVVIKTPSKRRIRLSTRPGDLILGTDGFHSVVRRDTLDAEYREIPGLARNWGAALSYNVPGLSDSLKSSGTAAKELSSGFPVVHRLRVFRQQTDQLYLGVSISNSEYLSSSKLMTLDTISCQLERTLLGSGKNCISFSASMESTSLVSPFFAFQQAP